MHSYIKILLGKAFETIPGELYNQYREVVAEQSRESYLFYELSLLEEKPWEFLSERVYPFFVRYLKAKHIDPENATGVVVAVFHEDNCHLLHGVDFLRSFAEIEEIDRAKLSERVQKWLSV